MNYYGEMKIGTDIYIYQLSTCSTALLTNR